MRHASVLARLRKGPACWPAFLLAALILLVGHQSVAVDLRALGDRVATGPSLDPADPDTLTIGRQDDLRVRTGPVILKAPTHFDQAAALPPVPVFPAPAPRGRVSASGASAGRSPRRRTASPRAPPARSDRN